MDEKHYQHGPDRVLLVFTRVERRFLGLGLLSGFGSGTCECRITALQFRTFGSSW